MSPRVDDHRIALAIFVLTAVCFGYFFGGGGWNQNVQMDLTRAIVEQRTIRIDSYAANTGDRSFYQGHVYSNKSPGTSFLAVVPYAALYVIESREGVDFGDPFVLGFNAWICTFVVCGLLGATIPAVLYLYGRSRFGVPRRRAAAIALVIALGSPLFPFATVLFAHVPSAALLLLAFMLADIDRPRWLLAGLFAGLAGLTNYLCIPPIALIALLTLRSGSWRRALPRYVLGSLAPLFLLAFYHYSAFGSPFTTPVQTTDPIFVTENAWMGVAGAPSLQALFGITISPYRGLFYASPVLIFAFAGMVIMLRQRMFLTLTVLASIVIFFIGFNTTFNGWEAGFSFGPRYLIPIIPLLGVAMLRSAGFWTPLWAMLAAISLVLNFVATAVDPTPSGSIGRPVTQYLFPLFMTGRPAPEVLAAPTPWLSRIEGHVSVNPHALDEIVPFSRHPPGSGPSEWAAFNLGELIFRPGSVVTVLPIVVWIVAGSGLLLWLARE
ncbi:MAG TPA: hypothetical protein VMT00_15305 [Thermoanaerobaculia bacterium]|nr:hypothetical protein [Thermoanaerobaculia bacterium]